MSMSTVGSPSAAAMRSIVSVVSTAGSPLASSTSPTPMHTSSTCCTWASDGTAGPTGRSRSSVGGPPCNRSCASRRTTPRNLRVRRPMTGSLAGVVAQGRRTQATALALAYIQWVSTAEKQVDTQSPDGGEVVGVPSIGETRGRPGRRVRPGPHRHPRGREAGRRARARGAGPLRGRAGQGRPALHRPGLVGQPDLLPHRARLPRHRTGRRQRRRRAGPELATTSGAPSRPASPPPSSPARWPPPTSSPPTRPRSSARSTPAARAWCAGCATSSATCATTAACPRWSSATRSRWARTSRCPPARSCTATRWASSSSTSPAPSRSTSARCVIIPPPIGRFYFLDLRPGRSFVEYATSQGIQVFLLSAGATRAPTEGEWDLDTYATRVLAAIDAAREISGSHDVNVMGFCAGGIITTTLLNHLAAIGDDRVHSMSYAVTLLDFGRARPDHGLPGSRAAALRQGPLAALGHHHQQADGRRVHLDAARRPGLQLLGQQLPHGRQAARVRHPGLERRRHEPARRAARPVPRHLRGQPAHQARRPVRAGHARCSSTRSRCRRSSPARSSTTSPRGSAATAPPSCSAAKPRSC